MNGENVMRKINKLGQGVVAAAALALSTAAVAYEPSDLVVRAGYASVNPNDSSTDLKVGGTTTLANTGVGVNDNAQLGLTTSYIFAPHWGVEVLAATPFQHDIELKGLGGAGISDGTKLGTTKQLPPTVSLQYYFLDSNSEWQPYVGVGVNYTHFFDSKTSSDAKAALDAHNLNLDDSIGVAGEIGLDWAVNKSWLVNVSVWKANIKTDASVDTALGRVTTKVTIDPVVYMIGAGYKF
jgi:outer membrane protein